MATSDQSRASTHSLFCVFSFMWSAAILIHQAKVGHLFMLTYDTPLSLVALWAMLKPSSVLRLCAAAAMHVATLVVFDLPFITNHPLVMVFSNIAILICLAQQWRATTDGAPLDAAAFYHRLAPVLRVHMLLLYFFATLAKVNWGFFDLEMSCAITMVGWLRNKLPFIPDNDFVRWSAIYGTIVVEAAIPILIAIPRTRVFGVAFSWAFHLMLGINGYYGFSSLAYAYYALFLPPDFGTRLQALRERAPSLDRAARSIGELAGRPRSWLAAVIAIVALGCVELVLGAAFDVDKTTVKRLCVMVFRPPWFAWALAVGAVYITAVRRDRPVPVIAGSLKTSNLLPHLASLCIVFNSMSPYLGLKNESSLTMFSNIQTEGDQWNHILVPEALRVFPHLTHLVEVVESSDPHMQKIADERRKLVYFHFRQLMNDRPDASITYRYRGQEKTVERAGDDPILGDPVNPFIRKIAWFRSVAHPERLICTH